MKVQNDIGEVFEAEQYLPDDGIEFGRIATKDPVGEVDIAPETWVLKSQSGEISLCHPQVFEAEFSEVGS